MANMRCEWTFKAERPGQGLTERTGTGNAELTDTIHILYQELCKYGYLITELYDLTIAELIEMLEARRKGHAYSMWKQAGLIANATLSKKYPESPENASPELYPAKKTYKMPQWLKERQKKGG